VSLQWVSDGDVDGLIAAWQRITDAESEIKAAKVELRARILKLTNHLKGKTRRLAGSERSLLIEMPGSGWDQSILKEAWFAYPQFAPSYLCLERLRPRLREIAKLQNMTGAGDFESFRKILLSAETDSTTTAKISLAKVR